LLKFFAFLLGTWLLIWILLLLLFHPSHNRDWELGQEKTPHFLQKEDELTVENFRDFDWYDGESADGKYETRTFNLSQIESTDVFISHFDDFEGLAHIFLSFGFSDGRHLVVSMETRREKGEKFSPFLGILRQFEIIYVVGSEADIVGLRTNIRNERVYLYQTIATPQKSRELLLKIAEDINGIFEKPKMYNTLLQNCTNVLTKRVEDISNERFPVTWKTILPGYFDEVLFEMGLLVDKGEFLETKEKSLIPILDINHTYI